MKARIWKDATGWLFGTYLPRLDGMKMWHYQSDTHWFEADTFQRLMEELRRVFDGK